LRRYDHYIGTTNFKVGLLLSFLTAVLISLVLKTTTIELIHATYYCQESIRTFILIATLLTDSIAIPLTLKAVFPITGSNNAYKSNIFFGDVAKIDGGAETYWKTIIASDEKALFKDLALQVHSVAIVVDAKFKDIQRSVSFTRWVVLPLVIISIIMLNIK